MLKNQKMTSRRLVLSARQLYFFQQQRKQSNDHVNDDIKNEKEENQVYVLGYN